jgi:hypothetical protein
MIPVASCGLLSSLPANEFGLCAARQTAGTAFFAGRRLAWLTPFRTGGKVYQNPTSPQC